MLTPDEYNELLPFRPKIMAFKERGNYKGDDSLHIIDKIRQKRSMGAICYSCSESKVNALNDIMALMQEYEEETAKNKTDK